MQVLFVVFSAAGVIPIGSLLRRCEAALDEERDALARARAATRAAEDAVRELSRGRGLLESFVENAPTMVYIKDREGRYELVNEAFATAAGQSAGYFLGKTMEDVLPPELAPMAERMRAADAQVLATGTSVETHEILPTARRFLVTRFPIRSADGEIRGIGGIATDLTELEERALHAEESEARHRAIFDGIRHAVLIATSQGTVVDMNDGATRLFGASREKILDSPPRLRRGESEVPLVIPPGLAAAPGTSEALEATFERADGATFDAELRFAELPLHSGRHVLWIVRDVSAERAVERKRRAENAELEARVAARTRELLSTNQELSAFSYSVSHDLRAPLRQVSGYVRLLQEHLERTGGEGDAELASAIDRVKEAAESMARLIDGLLRAARAAEARRVEP
jgi:PAS domain S-box-containing protein